METLQETARAVTSKPVQRAVVNTVLLVSSAVSLFCFAAIACAVFFQNFVPDRYVTTPVHLQYGHGTNPFGIVSLTTSPLKAQQDYDISITMSMPRSPANLERGNFMVSIHLLDSDAHDRSGTKQRQFIDGRMDLHPHKVLFSSRRPALVPYVDPIISVASRVLLLLYHIIFPSSQMFTMTIPLAERVSFTKNAAVPTSAYLEIEAGQGIQVYSAALTMTAQLRGLRYLMFHYRLLTYVTFTFLFWVCEVFCMGIAWLFWSNMAGPGPATGKDGRSLEDEEDEEDYEDEDGEQLSDHPHNFPTYGRQPPLKHEPGVKKEEDDDGERHERLRDIPIGGAEADDEDELDEDEDNASWKRDSGLGTSYSEEGAASIRKRGSRSRLD